MPTITPNPKKALFLAKKQLSELVYDAVNLEGIPPVEVASNWYQQYSHPLF
jgi:hypothetical protein